MSTTDDQALVIHFPDDPALRVLASCVHYADSLLTAHLTTLAKARHPFSRLIVGISATSKLAEIKLPRRVNDAIQDEDLFELLEDRAGLQRIAQALASEDAIAAQWAGISWVATMAMKSVSDYGDPLHERDTGANHIRLAALLAFLSNLRTTAHTTALDSFNKTYLDADSSRSACQLITADPQNPHVVVGPKALAAPLFGTDYLLQPFPLAVRDAAGGAHINVAVELVNRAMADEYEEDADSALWGDESDGHDNPALADSADDNGAAMEAAPSEPLPELFQLACELHPEITEEQKSLLLTAYNDARLAGLVTTNYHDVEAYRAHQQAIQQVPETLRHWFENRVKDLPPGAIENLPPQFAEFGKAKHLVSAVRMVFGHTHFKDLLTEDGVDLEAYIDTVTLFPGLSDLPCRKGKTPLHYVVMHGTPDQLTRFLAAAGAVNLDHRDFHGNTAYHLAATTRERSLLMTILDKAGASHSERNDNGATPFDVALTVACFPAVRRLLKKKPRIGIDTLCAGGAVALAMRNPNCPPDIKEMLRDIAKRISSTATRPEPDWLWNPLKNGIEPDSYPHQGNLCTCRACVERVERLMSL